MLQIFACLGGILVVASVLYIAHRAEETARELVRIRELLEEQAQGRSD